VHYDPGAAQTQTSALNEGDNQFVGLVLPAAARNRAAHANNQAEPRGVLFVKIDGSKQLKCVSVS
jgi:hypothetical protein